MNTSGPGKGSDDAAAVPPSKTGSLAFSANLAPSTTSAVVAATTTTEEAASIAPSIESTSDVVSYVLGPIGAILFCILVAGLIYFLIRKSRLDKLRHHLMPLYNFDPAEEGEDWESELLEDGMDHRMTAAHMKMRVER